jgi:hypothetical protein
MPETAVTGRATSRGIGSAKAANKTRATRDIAPVAPDRIPRIADSADPVAISNMLNQAKWRASSTDKAYEKDTASEKRPIEMASMPPNKNSANKDRMMLDCQGRF